MWPSGRWRTMWSATSRSRWIETAGNRERGAGFPLVPRFLSSLPSDLCRCTRRDELPGSLEMPQFRKPRADRHANGVTAVEHGVRQVHPAAGVDTLEQCLGPGPVFIQVVEGEVTFYEADDPDCKPTLVKKGESYLVAETGRVRNAAGPEERHEESERVDPLRPGPATRRRLRGSSRGRPRSR